MKKYIDVSIVIPIYNRAYGIEECIASIQLNKLKQFINVEVLICDDQSKDNVVEIVDIIKTDYPDIDMSLIRQKEGEKGANLARRNGVLNARGKYVVFLDSDDYIVNDSIMKRYEYIQDSKCDLVYGNAISRNVIRKFDDITKVNPRRYMMEELSLCPFSVIMVKRKVAESIDWNLINIPAWQDDAFIAELIMNDYKVGHCGEIVAEMEESMDSISKSNDKKLEGCKFLVSKYKNDIVKYTSVKRLLWWNERIIFSKLMNRMGDSIWELLLSEEMKRCLNRHFRHIWG